MDFYMNEIRIQFKRDVITSMYIICTELNDKVQPNRF